ncbi:MAG: MbtH family NRPS accessory protein [Jatrophihabitantaceae bacterium]
MFRDDRHYVVVQNSEDQYSLWPADRQPPTGWQAVTAGGSREECLEHIRRAWTDMRPRSLRQWMAAHGDPAPTGPSFP